MFVPEVLISDDLSHMLMSHMIVPKVLPMFMPEVYLSIHSYSRNVTCTLAIRSVPVIYEAVGI